VHPVARWSRYAAGSLIALATSELVLVATYGSGLLGTTPASVAAFLAGAVPNYLLNRRWVWQRSGRVRVRRELLPYVAVSLVSLVAGAGATGWAESAAPPGGVSRSVFVAVAYLAAYGFLFMAKFAAYELYVFSHRPGRIHRAEIHRSEIHRSEIHRAEIHRAESHRAESHEAGIATPGLSGFSQQ
jgi:putative flippase GtrA